MNKLLLTLLVLVLLFAPPTVARADIAPPEAPPGANIAPGSENTQVRMLAETVLIEVLGDASGQAAVSASFMMRNLGASTETLEVRFPLTFWNGESDGWGNYPEITDLRVKVDAQLVSTGRYTSADPPVPWATFEVTFAPEEVVIVEVAYTATATREYEDGPPFIAFAYVLETGAGWKDTIGSVDLIVRLPYEAEPYNVVLAEGVTGFANTTPGAVLSGTELRWHYEDLEPGREHNLEVALIDPALWMRVLAERENTAQRPNDGEAWGRLGRLYKEALRVRRGVRSDPDGEALFALAEAAYRQAVTLQPDDALWHAGYGELLAERYKPSDGEIALGQSDYWHDLAPAFEELHLAYSLDPGNAQIHAILERVGLFAPGSILASDGAYTFAFLTATPTSAATATEQPGETSAAAASPTPEPTQTRPAAPSLTPAAAEDDPSGSEAPRLPVCGFGLLFLPLGLLLIRHRRARFDEA